MLGLIDETLQLRGMRYYPTDIESTISRCSQRITNRFDREFVKCYVRNFGLFGVLYRDARLSNDYAFKLCL